MVRDGRATKVGFMVAILPSWINLDSVAPSEFNLGFRGSLDVSVMLWI